MNADERGSEKLVFLALFILFLIRFIFFSLICVHLWLHFRSIRKRVVTFNHDGLATLETFDDLNLFRCANADRHFCLMGEVLIVYYHYRTLTRVACFERDG